MDHRLVKQLVSAMTEKQKKDLLQRIQLENGVNMLLGKRVNKGLLNYTIALLRGQDPHNPLTYEKKI